MAHFYLFVLILCSAGWPYVCFQLKLLQFCCSTSGMFQTGTRSFKHAPAPAPLPKPWFYSFWIQCEVLVGNLEVNSMENETKHFGFLKTLQKDVIFDWSSMKLKFLVPISAENIAKSPSGLSKPLWSKSGSREDDKLLLLEKLWKLFDLICQFENQMRESDVTMGREWTLGKLMKEIGRNCSKRKKSEVMSESFLEVGWQKSFSKCQSYHNFLYKVKQQSHFTICWGFKFSCFFSIREFSFNLTFPGGI